MSLLSHASGLIGGRADERICIGRLIVDRVLVVFYRSWLTALVLNVRSDRLWAQIVHGMYKYSFVAIIRRPPGGRLDSENPAPGGRRLFCKQL